MSPRTDYGRTSHPVAGTAADDLIRLLRRDTPTSSPLALPDVPIGNPQSDSTNPNASWLVALIDALGPAAEAVPVTIILTPASSGGVRRHSQ
jgi:hypothetical protein